MKYNELATLFIQAIKDINANPENLDNFECYLSYHFPEWLEKFANTPEGITSEMRNFAGMTI